MSKIYVGGHRGMGCTDDEFFQDIRDIDHLPVENTHAGIEMAFNLGAVYVEVDAQMSSDGVIFVLHSIVPQDHFFTHPIPPRSLNQMTFAEIRKFATGRNGQGQVATLDEILNLAADLAPDQDNPGFRLNIEIKGVQGSEQPFETNNFLQGLADTVRQSRLPNQQVLFSSFCLQNAIGMARLIPEAQYGMLFWNETSAIYSDHADNSRYQYLNFNRQNIDYVLDIWRREAPVGTRLAYIHPEILTIRPEILQAAVDNGLGINAYTFKENLTETRKNFYRQLFQAVRKTNLSLTIITDYVAEMLNLLKEEPKIEPGDKYMPG